MPVHRGTVESRLQTLLEAVAAYENRINQGFPLEAGTHLTNLLMRVDEVIDGFEGGGGLDYDARRRLHSQLKAMGAKVWKANEADRAARRKQNAEGAINDE